MGEVTCAIHKHHQDIVSRLSRQVAAIINRCPDADPDALVALLKNDLRPHAIVEERYLYPVIEQVVKDQGRITDTMCIDHEYIQGYIDWIEETAEELKTADEEERPALEALFERLCLQLEAVLQLHMAKEERVYLPLIEQFVPEEEQERILSSMQEPHHALSPGVSGGASHVEEATPQLHDLIFE